MNKIGSLPENILRCLSMTQPWASLVAIGAKKIETRSWQTSYRGRLGIHAALGFPKDARALCLFPPFKQVLMAAGIESLADLPLGAVLATVQLDSCVSTERIRDALAPQELAFGNYDHDRYAWIFKDVRALAVPVPAKGMLGLWTMDASLFEAANGDVGRRNR